MHCSKWHRLVLAVVVCGLSQQDAVIAADWPTFRGPDRTGVSKETDLLEKWPEGGPRLVWTAKDSGRGYTSLAISGGRIYAVGDATTEETESQEFLLCYDAKNGKQLWAVKTGPAWKEGKPDWQSSRSTPTVDGNQAFVLTANGELICCDAKSGKEQWRKDVKKDFGGNKADIWGYSESVLVDGDKVVCTPGGDKATMVAVNRRSGDVIWTAVRPEDRGAGHASIVVSEVGGVRVYVQTTGSGALGVRADDGKLLWSYPIEKTTAVIPTPIVRGDLVFFSVGYKRGGALLRQKADGKGGVTMEEVYPLNTQLANKHGGVVLVGDYLFGDSDDAGIPYCAELMTGKIVWKERGSGKGSAAMSAADGHLYIHFADGTVVLAKADPAEYVEVSKFVTPESGERPGWAHPVILDGKLYIRENGVILCYEVAAKSSRLSSTN